MMTREEHLRWCKDRAMEYVNAGDYSQAVASMMSDLGKHPDTEKSADALLGLVGMSEAQSGDRLRVKRWVEGFN